MVVSSTGQNDQVKYYHLVSVVCYPFLWSDIMSRFTCRSYLFRVKWIGKTLLFSYPNTLSDISFCFSNLGMSTNLTGNDIPLKFKIDTWSLCYHIRSASHCARCKAAKTDHMKHLLSLFLTLMMARLEHSLTGNGM
jgi:hypothetical protein